MGQVIDMARAAGATINYDTREEMVDDMPLNGIQPPPNTDERTIDESIMFGIDHNARAYDTNTIGRMALMTYGRYMAALNAETYAQTALGESFMEGSVKMIHMLTSDSRHSQYTGLGLHPYNSGIDSPSDKHSPSQCLHRTDRGGSFCYHQRAKTKFKSIISRNVVWSRVHFARLFH